MSGEARHGVEVLPPDGTPLRANEWRQQVLWIVCACVGVLTVLVAASVIDRGRPAGLLAVAGYGLFAVVLARAAMAGLLLDDEGIKVRKAIKTRRWRWDEIERLELREPGERHRLRVHLRDGTTHKLSGFFAWSAKEEAKSQELFRALQTRLDQEHARTTSMS
jgi:Bacterial PH domain